VTSFGATCDDTKINFIGAHRLDREICLLAFGPKLCWLILWQNKGFPDQIIFAGEASLLLSKQCLLEKFSVEIIFLAWSPLNSTIYAGSKCEIRRKHCKRRTYHIRWPIRRIFVFCVIIFFEEFWKTKEVAIVLGLLFSPKKLCLFLTKMSCICHPRSYLNNTGGELFLLLTFMYNDSISPQRRHE
jgi:hypothetical protein